MIDRKQLLSDLQKFLQRIEADLLERSESTEVPEVPAALHAEYEKAAKAERTAQNYEDWRTDTITQAAATWVLSCVFVRFLEDNSLIDPPRISGQLSVVSGQLKTENRLERARDEHEMYFRKHPQHTDREYLLSIFEQLAKLPGTRDIFGEHNAIRDLPNWLSGDAAGKLLTFFQKIDASTGLLVHDFIDPNWDTRFLGDLYQDLSEAARKKFALLQTPDFVEEFILDRTLDPAIDEFGLGSGQSSVISSQSKTDNRQLTTDNFRMIDPACGSGHFLLGAFPRLLDRWQRKEPGTNVRELTQRALDSIHGVDINPFAVAIARFRLLLVAMKACDIRRLADAPGFRINVACGDSLLHGENRTSTGQGLMDFVDGATDEELYSHSYPGEDLQTVRALLKTGTYHCVVANPPYIVPKDRKLNDWYRKRFSACHMKYSLAVPFMQQIFQLVVRGGYTGQITANSFMKREFGKKLIESFFPTVDLTHVIDTSGAYIPGHGTPTTILFGRNREYVGSTLRTVLGIRGEPSTPDDPAHGLVWSSIIRLVDRCGERNEFVSSGDSERALFHKHPWSIGGGGASELKEVLEENTTETLSARSESIGITSFTLEDDLYILPMTAAVRDGMSTSMFRPMIVGDIVRDWTSGECEVSVFPYNEEFQPIKDDLANPSLRYLWHGRIGLSANKMFGGKTKLECGLKWFEYGRLTSHKLRTPLTIVFAEVATHNHFVLDRGGKVFKQTAPVIKLPADATEDDHLALLGVLNSSTACLWLRLSAPDKGMSGGIVEEQFERFFMFNSSLIEKFPLPNAFPLALSKHIDLLSLQITLLAPQSILKARDVSALNGGAVAFDSQGCKPLECKPHTILESRSDGIGSSGASDIASAQHMPTNATAPPFSDRVHEPTRGLHPGLSNTIAPRFPDDSVTHPRGLHPGLSNDIAPRLNATELPLCETLSTARQHWEQTRAQMIAAQEDLDWECYKLYGLIDKDLTEKNSVSSVPPWLPLSLGQRAFEIVLARKIASGETQSTWFERHGSKPITELPAQWPDDYKRLVERRIELIENDPNIRLIEQPEYKRRWNTEPWDSQLERALREWLLLRLETYFDFDGRMGEDREPQGASRGFRNSGEEEPAASAVPLREIAMYSVTKLADAARQDPQLLEVGELYRDDPAFDVQKLVEELVAAESVPHLPILLYKDTGLRKRAEWEKTWDLQRREDAEASIQCSVFSVQSDAETENRKPKTENSIPVPPKYISADFISTGGARYWSLRGKLDVPKERLDQLPALRRPRRHAGHQRLLRPRPNRVRRQRRSSAHPLARLLDRAPPLAQAMAQRTQRQLRRPPHGRLF